MKITNRSAFRDFDILETYETGLVLTGAEVKSIKGNRMTLVGAYVKIIGSEMYLVNAQVFPYEYARPEGYDPKRTRKLLMHKKEIIRLKTKLQGASLTLVPLACYNKHGFIKLNIGLARGKREYEKREKIKKRDLQRQIQRELREKI